MIFIIGNLKRQRKGGKLLQHFCHVPSYQSSWAILIVMQLTLKIPSSLKGISNYKTTDKCINDLQLQPSWTQLSYCKKNVLWLASVSWGIQALRNSLTITWFIILMHNKLLSTTHTHCLNLFVLIRAFNTLNHYYWWRVDSQISRDVLDIYSAFKSI